MPRILAACLAMLLTANGWVVLPAGYIDTGGDVDRSAYAGRLFHQGAQLFPNNGRYTPPCGGTSGICPVHSATNA